MYRATLFFLFFKLIGLAPFSVVIVKQKKKQQESTVSFVRTKFGIFYNVSISCLIIASNYITVPILYSEEYLNKTVITTICEIAEAVLGSLTICTILLCYCWNQSLFMKFGNRLINILYELRRLREQVDYKRIIFVLSLVYSFQLFLLVVLLPSDYLSFQTQPVSWLATILPLAIVCWLFIQYFFVLTVIHATFVNLNRSIRNVYVNRIEGVNIDCLQRSRCVFINNAKIQSILQLRSVHGHLCDVCVEVSKFYALPVLVGTALIFICLLYNMYYIFELFLLENIQLGFWLMLNSSVWVVFIIYPFCLLTNKAVDVVNEIEETGSIVHSLLNYTIDKEVISELKLFSLQLLHRRIKFVAYGYFVLDNTLVQSMLSTMTTYLVILIQFQMSDLTSNDCHCNCTHSDRGTED